MLNRKPYSLYLTLVMTAGLLAGCLKIANATPPPEVISTQVAQALTSIAASQPPPPVITQLVTLPVTETPPLPTETATLPLTETPILVLTETPTLDGTVTATPTGTHTVVPTVPRLPTVTLPTSDPKNNLGEPTLHDLMDSTNNVFYWYTYTEEGNSSFTLEENQLVMIDYKHGANWIFSALKPIENFYLEFTFNVDACSGNDAYGIIFRAPDNDNGYLAGITCDGTYSIRRWNDKEKKMVIIINWKESDAISQGSGQTNRLGIMADGAHLGIYINGKLVNEAISSTYLEGKFGPYISGAVTTGLTVKISEVYYWQMK